MEDLLKGLKILVVDDDAELREGVACFLEHAGGEVFEASSGKKGVEFLNKHMVDVIVSDIRMPDGDGLFLIQQINKNLTDNRPYIIFFSGYSDIAKSQLLAEGAVDVLEKPLSMPDLVERIQKLTA